MGDGRKGGEMTHEFVWAEHSEEAIWVGVR